MIGYRGRALHRLVIDYGGRAKKLSIDLFRVEMTQIRFGCGLVLSSRTSGRRTQHIGTDRPDGDVAGGCGGAQGVEGTAEVIAALFGRQAWGRAGQGSNCGRAS